MLSSVEIGHSFSLLCSIPPFVTISSPSFSVWIFGLSQSGLIMNKVAIKLFISFGGHKKTVLLGIFGSKIVMS